MREDLAFGKELLVHNGHSLSPIYSLILSVYAPTTHPVYKLGILI